MSFMDIIALPVVIPAAGIVSLGSMFTGSIFSGKNNTLTKNEIVSKRDNLIDSVKKSGVTENESEKIVENLETMVETIEKYFKEMENPNEKKWGGDPEIRFEPKWLGIPSQRVRSSGSVLPL